MRVYLTKTMVVALVLSLGVAPARAQETLSADEKELAAYRLTEATTLKMLNVMRHLGEEMKQDPRFKEIQSLKQQIKALNDKEERTEAEDETLQQLEQRKEELEEKFEGNNSADDVKTISDMERAVKAQPMAMRALQKEGITPREYAKFFLAMIQAGFVVALSQGKVDYAKLPAGINPENVKFVEQNKALLDQFQKIGTDIDK